MKSFLYLVAFPIMLAACSGSRAKKSLNVDSLTSHLKPGKHCYLAVFEKDSAKLILNITNYGKISGKLSINYEHADTVTRLPTRGEITGDIKGDTLIGDYAFFSGPKGQTRYINPVALLHKGDTLIMGYGTVYQYLGRNYFDPNRPIGFSKSKFRFLPVKCNLVNPASK